MSMLCQEMEQFLDEIEEYLDSRSDVDDGDYGQPVANKEMALASMLESARRAQKASP